MQFIPSKNGHLLRVKVVPGASRQKIVGPYGDGIKIAVTAAPERGAANEAVLEVLAAALNLPRSNLSITRGQTNPRKEIEIVGLSMSEIEQRLTASQQR